MNRISKFAVTWHGESWPIVELSIAGTGHYRYIISLSDLTKYLSIIFFYFSASRYIISVVRFDKNNIVFKLT